MEDCQISIINSYITELQKEFSSVSFKRIEKKDGMYVTNSVNKSMHNDAQIFKETHVKRTLYNFCASRLPKNIQNKLSYFSQEEYKNENKIYKFDKVIELNQKETFAVQNVGHATLLIQIPDFKILTDPVFSSLNWLLYPAKTRSHPTLQELPQIDIIIISHNHRDHLDKESLQKLLECYELKQWVQPKVFVPMGDKQLIKSFGFHHVEEVEWYTKLSVSKITSGKETVVNFISIPVDHRSGRIGMDHHKSLVSGWIINPINENVIFKFSGDTRSLTIENQLAVDAVLWYEIKIKAIRNENIELPDIVCFEPSGPNYTRCYMDVTHQSTSYSVLLKFIEAENLSNFSGKKSDDFLCKIQTIIMHHNKFELGTDRFNEGIFIFKKLYEYLNLCEGDLNKEFVRQEEKLKQHLDCEKLKQILSCTSRPITYALPQQSSILVHSKDFIIRDILEIINRGIKRELVKEFLLNNTLFPKIGERLNRNEILNSKFDINCVKKYMGKYKF